MQDPDRPDAELETALAAELVLLGIQARRPNLIESIMRLRALGELNHALDTASLLQLAAQASSKVRQPS